MGTTATVVGVFGARLYLAQVGDSRAYLVRRGEAVQLTKDQSLTQRLIDAGELTEEEAEQSERRNIIPQALGPEVEPDPEPAPAPPPPDRAVEASAPVATPVRRSGSPAAMAALVVLVLLLLFLLFRILVQS